MKDEIQKAIGAHSLWKGRLHRAIETGKSEFTVADVAVDNKCEFGKWLYSVAPGSGQSNGHRESVKRLHAAFHKEVANVLTQALDGNRDLALKAMDMGTPYAVCSTNLTAEMMNWARIEV